MIVDLFAGPGGWDEGAKALGVKTVGVEIDPPAIATRQKAGHYTMSCDVEKMPPFEEVEGLIASPPCQDFSSAGTKAGRDGGRGRLIDVVPRWVQAARPTWVACEQVPEALPVWQEHAVRYRALGYRVWFGTLNAAGWGVPQTRRRAFLLAHRDRDVLPPAPTHTKYGGNDLFGGELERWVTAADAGVPGVIDRRQQHDGKPVATVDGNRNPAPTVTGTAVGQWLVDGQLLTVAQAARLQTFRDDYPWQGTKGQQGTQVGNAVPPLLARRVLEVLL